MQNIFKSEHVTILIPVDIPTTNIPCVLGVEAGLTFFFYSVASASSFLSISVLSSWNSSLWFVVSAVQLGDVRLVFLPFPPSASAAIVAT